MKLSPKIVFTLFLGVSDAFSTQAVFHSSLQKNDSITANCETTCQVLAKEFNSTVYFGNNDPTFVIWDLKQQNIIPACRVTPSNSENVAKILEIVSSYWCRFAVKGGGHSTHIDASVSDGGVTIDLNQMKHIEIGPDSSWADLGPGLVLGDAYSYLESYNLTNIGGRVADVGLPGYAIGGGISNLSPQYGLALVLPNATIVNVTEDSQPDLYFALRGGGNNFGIVTNFRARLIQQGQMLSGSKVYNVNYTDAIVDQVYQLTTTLANDTNMSFSSRYAYNQTLDEFTIDVSQAYTQPVLTPAVFDVLNEIPYESSSVRVDWMSNFAAESVQPPGLRQLFATVTFHPSQDLHKAIIAIFEEEISAVKDAPGFTSSVIISALHVNAIEAMKSRGGNALGVESDGPLDIALLTVGWSNATDDADINSYADTWVERSKSAATDAGLLHPWLYINYAKGNQDPFSGYGDANKARLEKIQAEIDPDGIFTSSGLCRGSFKVR
ncbi:FAD binding domain protein [Pestalotiopsis sp. NC0098]|nr:FAD binding domain protein [Pestalotiopsis sp. NC0098]